MNVPPVLNIKTPEGKRTAAAVGTGVVVGGAAKGALEYANNVIENGKEVPKFVAKLVDWFEVPKIKWQNMIYKAQENAKDFILELNLEGRKAKSLVKKGLAFVDEDSNSLLATKKYLDKITQNTNTKIALGIGLASAVVVGAAAKLISSMKSQQKED